MPPRTRSKLSDRLAQEEPDTQDEPSDKYAITAWGQINQYLDMTVPSGQMCLIKQPGVQNLVAANVLDDVDTLSTLVADKHVRRVKGQKPVIDGQSLMQDPQNMLRVLATVDKVVEYMVVKPTVLRPVIKTIDDNGEVVERPMRNDERDSTVVYTDALTLPDRMFIFQFAVGGSDTPEQFREKFEAAMGSMETE